MMNDDMPIGCVVVMFVVALFVIVAISAYGITTSLDDGNFSRACIQAGGVFAKQTDLGRICVPVEDLIEVQP